MKHDRELRDEARHIYELHYIEADADFFRAERKREPAYLDALDAALERRRAGWEYQARMAQLPLL